MSDSLTFTAARDEIMALFKAAADTFVVAPEIFYQDTGREPLDSLGGLSNNPDNWMYVSVQHFSGQQTTIGNGLRRFERTGQFRAEIYTPKGTGLSLSDAACKVVADAFEGQKSPSGIWFRNVRMDEIGPDGVWFRVDVIADFRYDERK